jgi:hypothetical protein
MYVQNVNVHCAQRPNSWTKSLLFTVTSTVLPWNFYLFKLAQPLKVSTVQLLYIVKEKRGKPDRKPYTLPYGLRNLYRNLQSENSQYYAQKPQRNCAFMNLASVLNPNCWRLTADMSNKQILSIHNLQMFLGGASRSPSSNRELSSYSR